MRDHAVDDKKVIDLYKCLVTASARPPNSWREAPERPCLARRPSAEVGHFAGLWENAGFDPSQL